MGESLEELCRLCAAFDPVKMPIFSSEGKQRNLIVKIQTCLRFKVAEEDGFPSSVCYRCMFNLENYYDFYETCIRAQTLLQSKIGEGGDSSIAVNAVNNKEEVAGLPNAERPFPCDLCPTSFMSAKDRWTHVSQNHKGDARITCIFCRKGFSTISNLNFHKKNKHPEEIDELERKLKPLPKLQKINDIPKIQNKTYETVRNFLNNKTENILQDARHTDLANFNVKIGNTDIKFGNTSITVGNTDIRIGGSDRVVENKSMIDRLKNLGVEVSTGNVKNNELQQGDNKKMLEELEQLRLQKVLLKRQQHHQQLQLQQQQQLQQLQQLQQQQHHQRMYPGGGDESNADFQNPEDLLELDLELEGGDNIENMIESESVFGCEVCLRDFKDRSSLWLHMLYSHKVEAGYTCGICLKLCLTYRELSEHCNSCKDQLDSEKRRYFCVICYRQHESKKKLESHTSIHNLNDDYIKENFDLNNLIATNPTMTEKFKYEDYVEADVSEYSDTYSQELDATNDSTQNSLTGNGSAQHGYYDDVQNYRDHLAYQNFLEGSGHFLESSSFFDNVKTEENKAEMNQSEDQNKFKCDECFRSYETSLQLTKHKYNVHKNPNRIQFRNDSFGNPVYECDTCGQTYESPKQLTKHRYNVHKFPASMTQIMPAFEEPPKNMFSCNECPRMFETPRQLQKHRYNVHKIMRRQMVPGQPGCDSPSSVESFKPNFHYSSFDCEICGEKSTSKTERWKHCYKQHQNDERLVCSNEDCRKIMPTENFQKEHMNFHAMQGKHPICCEICSKLWSTKMEFWKHVSGVHYSLIGLTCGVCMKMFLTLDELKEHIKTHEPLSEAEFNCDICGRGYSSKPKMTRHRLIHEHDPDNDEYNILKHTLLKGNKQPAEKGKYQILNIPKVNRNYENDLEIIEVNPDDNGLMDHEHDETMNNLWCDVCPDMTFADLDDLRQHRRNIHALYPCDLCPKFYGGVSHLWKHTNRSHKGHPEITCEYCGKTSASRIQLRGHINKNHKEILLGHVVSEGGNPSVVIPDPDPTNLNCRRCGREFRIRSLVRRHEKTCLTKVNFDPDPTNLNCQKCGKYYPIRSLVRRHEKACLNRIIKDVDPANLNCKVCGKQFPKRSYCRRHERTCGTKKERPPKDEGPVELNCEWCPKQFNNRRAYASHVDYMHSIVNCEICEETEEKATFRSKTDLYNHCKEKHGDHPDLLCTFDKCRRLLRNKSDLEKHMRDHKNRDNPPTCEYCADIFKGRKKLRIHMLHQHKGEESRKFVCGVCVKVHDDTEKLMAHAHEAHAKIMERDFVCKICAKQYNCNAKVLDHHKNCHESTYKPCKVCLRIFTDEDLLKEHLQQHAVGDRSVNADLVSGHQCSLCQESYDTVVLLHEHVKENHPNLKDFSCPICGRKYQSIYTCYDHMENKHGNTYVTCRKCLMIFTSKEEKSEHMMTHGILEDTDNLTCTLCRIKNETEEALEAHILESHPELFEELADRNMCLICSKVLKYKYSIYCHVEKNHPNNYCCRLCLMIYKEKEKLDDHILRLHTRDKAGNPPVFSPNKSSKKMYTNQKRPKNLCFICQKIEEDTASLRKHVEVEHAFVLTKELTCFLCGQGYSSRFKVFDHIKSYHGPPYTCCRKCLKIFDNEEELTAHAVIHESEITPRAPRQPRNSKRKRKTDSMGHCKRAKTTKAQKLPDEGDSFVTEEGEDEIEEETLNDEEIEEEMDENDEIETSVDGNMDVKEEMEEDIDDSEMDFENPSENPSDDEESKIKEEDDEDDDELDDDIDGEESENDDDDEDEDDDDEDEDDEEDETREMEEKEKEDSYVCEQVKNDKGSDEFKLKIKHSIGKSDEEIEKMMKKEDASDEIVRNGKGCDESNTSSDENMVNLVGGIKRETSCGAE